MEIDYGQELTPVEAWLTKELETVAELINIPARLDSRRDSHMISEVASCFDMPLIHLQ